MMTTTSGVGSLEHASSNAPLAPLRHGKCVVPALSPRPCSVTAGCVIPQAAVTLCDDAHLHRARCNGSSVVLTISSQVKPRGGRGALCRGQLVYSHARGRRNLLARLGHGLLGHIPDNVRIEERDPRCAPRYALAARLVVAWRRGAAAVWFFECSRGPGGKGEGAGGPLPLETPAASQPGPPRPRRQCRGSPSSPCRGHALQTSQARPTSTVPAGSARRPRGRAGGCAYFV